MPRLASALAIALVSWSCSGSIFGSGGSPSGGDGAARDTGGDGGALASRPAPVRHLACSTTNADGLPATAAVSVWADSIYLYTTLDGAPATAVFAASETRVGIPYVGPRSTTFTVWVSLANLSMQIEEALGNTWIDADGCQELTASGHWACTAAISGGATVYVDAWHYPDPVALPAFFAASLWAQRAGGWQGDLLAVGPSVQASYAGAGAMQAIEGGTAVPGTCAAR